MGIWMKKGFGRRAPTEPKGVGIWVLSLHVLPSQRMEIRGLQKASAQARKSPAMGEYRMCSAQSNKRDQKRTPNKKR